jgi:hypothetical protein
MQHLGLVEIIMANRKSEITQSEIARAVRAAKQAGAKAVIIELPNAKFTVIIDGVDIIPKPSNDIEQEDKRPDYRL